jgi:hypothetical protein
LTLYSWTHMRASRAMLLMCRRRSNSEAIWVALSCLSSGRAGVLNLSSTGALQPLIFRRWDNNRTIVHWACKLSPAVSSDLPLLVRAGADLAAVDDFGTRISLGLLVSCVRQGTLRCRSSFVASLALSIAGWSDFCYEPVPRLSLQRHRREAVTPVAVLLEGVTTVLSACL